MAILKKKQLNIRIIIAVIVAMIISTVYVWAESDGQVISTEGVSVIAIKAANNTFRIVPWDRSEVMVKALSDVKQPGEGTTEIQKMDKNGDRIEIEAKASSPTLIEYEVSMPEDMNLEIKSMNSSIYVTDIRGKKTIETFNGNVELNNVVGSVSAKTFNGNILADIRFDEKSDFVTVNGSIDIRVKDTFSVPISITTVSGSITMTLPDGYSTDIDASAVSGQIISDLPLDGGQDGHSLKGKLFGGGPPLKLKTVSGSINIGLDQTNASPKPSPEQSEKPTAKTEETNVTKIDKSALPDIEVIKTLDPPVIDGRLDDKTWKSAGKIENFIWADGIRKPHEATEAYLLWDDQNLYIGIRCYESNMDKIKISNTEKDEEIWDDDNIQIIIDPTPETETDYYHITINPIGTTYDQEISRADIERRRTIESNLGKKWNSEGAFSTDIRDNFWTVEASIPISSFTKIKHQEGDVWRLNLHRIEQQRKEYTYWSPTYFAPEWPHVPARFGELVFSGIPSLVEAPIESLEPSEPESSSTIADIIIKGNNRISQDEIIDTLKLKIGDLADVDSLSRAKQKLESLGWFQNIGMDLVKNETGVKLIVIVLEKEIISPSAVVVEGSTVFSREELVKYFNLAPTKTTTQDMTIKCKLIAELYKSRGYEMVNAKCSVLSNVLTISIDEGRIDKIEVYGNNRIPTKDIINYLNLKPGMPYKKDDINNAINTMRSKLPYFRSVNWNPSRSADGLNIVRIEVHEGNLIDTSHNGIFEFDRVHGLQLGLKPEVKSNYWGSKVYFGFRYGFSSEIWNYQVGAEKSWFRDNKGAAGIEVHKMTDTNDRELVSDAEHFIAEAILGEAFRDFYQREGYELNFSQELPFAAKIGLKYRDDEYSSLSKTNDWSLLNRSYAEEEESRRNIDNDVKYKRDNPPILEGRMKSIIGECTIDTKNSKKGATNGWYNTFSVEYAGNELGGGYDFILYQANIRRYNRISGNQYFTFRVKAGTTDRELPELHPKKFYLGGVGTLRGYSFKEFEGDKMVLINAEYWLTSWIDVVFFVDSGYAWNYNSEAMVKDLKTDVGFGIGMGSIDGGFMVNVAKPIEEGNQKVVVSVRLSRMF